MPPIKVPTEIPLIFYSGDTLYFTVQNSDYSPVDGWSMIYEFSSEGPDDITNTLDSGSNYLFNISSETTGSWASGDFTWRSYVRKVTETGEPPDVITTTEQYPVSTGTISIRDSTYQSVAKKKIDAIEAYLSNTSTYADYEWTMKSLGDMSVSRGGNPRKEAREDLAYWKTVYNAEIQRERMASGKETGDRTVWTRFTKN